MTLIINRHGQPTARRIHDLHATINGFPAYIVGDALYVMYPVGTAKSGWCLDRRCSDCRWVGCGCDCHEGAS